MANSTLIQVPRNLDDKLELGRFLDKLVQQVDIAFGYRGDGGFVATGGSDLTRLSNRVTTLDTRIAANGTNLTDLQGAIAQLRLDVTALENAHEAGLLRLTNLEATVAAL